MYHNDNGRGKTGSSRRRIVLGVRLVSRQNVRASWGRFYFVSECNRRDEIAIFGGLVTPQRAFQYIDDMSFCFVLFKDVNLGFVFHHAKGHSVAYGRRISSLVNSSYYEMLVIGDFEAPILSVNSVSASNCSSL